MAEIVTLRRFRFTMAATHQKMISGRTGHPSLGRSSISATVNANMESEMILACNVLYREAE